MDDRRLVIFDCDGVLIDSEMIACRVDAECLAEIGFPITADDIRERYVGLSSKAMVADLEARHQRPLPADFLRLLRGRIERAFESELKATPDIAEAVDALPFRRCVASSSSLERLEHALSIVGLFDLFHPHIFSATQVANGKPAPDLFLFAAEKMNAVPADCTVVEDSVAGVRAGLAAGMRTIGFTGGSHCDTEHADRLYAAGASVVIARMKDLPRALDA